MMEKVLCSTVVKQDSLEWKKAEKKTYLDEFSLQISRIERGFKQKKAESIEILMVLLWMVQKRDSKEIRQRLSSSKILKKKLLNQLDIIISKEIGGFFKLCS